MVKISLKNTREVHGESTSQRLERNKVVELTAATRGPGIHEDGEDRASHNGGGRRRDQGTQEDRRAELSLGRTSRPTVALERIGGGAGRRSIT